MAKPQRNGIQAMPSSARIRTALRVGFSVRCGLSGCALVHAAAVAAVMTFILAALGHWQAMLEWKMDRTSWVQLLLTFTVLNGAAICSSSMATITERGHRSRHGQGPSQSAESRVSRPLY
jgi:hypothetical protein